MPTPVAITAGSCSTSGCRLLAFSMGNKRATMLMQVTGKRTLGLLRRQQHRHGHTWISGHPHNTFYKPTTATKKTNAAGGTTCSHSSSSGFNSTPGNGASSSGNTSSFLDFAGNGRYQAYNLARFSTFSAVSSSSSSSSSSSPLPLSATSPSGSQEPGSVGAASSSQGSHANKAYSNPDPVDAQSPLSSPSPPTTTATTATTTATSSSGGQDDKDDDWAVNESFSGHGAQNFSSESSSSSSTTTSNATTTPSSISSFGEDSDDNDDNSGYETSRTALQPSLSSFKSPSAIEASWRRTSNSLPSVTNLSGSSVLSSPSSSKAGGLDLSSSTLVQQMLFQDRLPHSSDSIEGDDSSSEQTDKGKQNGIDSDADVDEGGNNRKDDFDDWDIDEETSRERRHDGNQAQKDQRLALEGSSEPVTTSPSLVSMLLNQPSTNNSSSTPTSSTIPNKAKNQKTEQDDEDHISKLDIRVGIVRSVAQHPDADSLYIEQVDVGDKDGNEIKEPRTIVSGLVRHVPKDYLNGRAVIVVGNMKPSKLRGVMSQGMLLCAMEQDANGEVTKVGLLEPAEGSQAGDKVTIEGFTNEDTVPVPVLTPKRKWFEKSRVHFSVEDGIAYYKGSPFKTVNGLVRCKSILKGQIS
ncbi:hypothetical protein BG011_001550 [Mortierella polycephala]|uniref:tRNA-binding domain-containing protein n=1 Tax=Mortierella polycephala TaxID=41804 RepID=A0A9P6Q6B4_9FUNG|nr:hypothetical protein BG011_001550 [Mortierella polycephala]